MLEGVAKSAPSYNASSLVSNAPLEDLPGQTTEPYDPSMSPKSIDITKLPYEERQMDILLESDDRRDLVSSSVIERDIYLTVRLV